ncbi:hypothetical protein MA16_Dca017812 [Dendrobium catenatum]|uniref:Uncharacterized protein n=1 Tax=Dendrobium catenatum TaxID=906689 RepID=A0A2I0VFD3_9ASPA|nr:hypothetical protein MA16_Dca017812 [Dendrobium catenatum]
MWITKKRKLRIASTKREGRISKSNLEKNSIDAVNNSIEVIAVKGMLEQVLIEPIMQIPLVEGEKEDVHSKEVICSAGLITRKNTEQENAKAGFTKGIPAIKNKFEALGSFNEEGEIVEVNIPPVIQILERNATQEVLTKTTNFNKEDFRDNEDSSSTIKKKGIKQLKGLGPINLKTKNRKTDGDDKEKGGKSFPLIYK